MPLFSHGIGKPHSGRRSGNFRVIKFSRRNIFVVQENSSNVLRFSDLERNESHYANETRIVLLGNKHILTLSLHNFT